MRVPVAVIELAAERVRVVLAVGLPAADRVRVFVEETVPEVETARVRVVVVVGLRDGPARDLVAVIVGVGDSKARVRVPVVVGDAPTRVRVAVVVGVAGPGRGREAVGLGVPRERDLVAVSVVVPTVAWGWTGVIIANRDTNRVSNLICY